MTFGAHFVTDFGNLLIDETFKSLAVASSGTIVTDTAHPLGSYKTFSYTGTNPVLALQDNTPFGIDQQGKSGANWQVQIFSTGPIGTVIKYWVFDDCPATVPSGFGMVVRNAAGAIVFNSNYKYLRVVDQPHIPIAVGETDVYASGRDYAVVFCNGNQVIRSVSHMGGDFTTTWSLFSADIDSNSITFDTNIWQTGLTPDDESYFPGFNALVVDVTDY